MLVSAFLESLAAAAVQPSTAGAQPPPDANAPTFASLLGEASDTPNESTPNEAGQQEDSASNDTTQPLAFLFLWAPPAPPVAIAPLRMPAELVADDSSETVETSGSVTTAYARSAHANSAGNLEIPVGPAPMAAAPVVSDVPAPEIPNPQETPAPAVDVAPGPVSAPAPAPDVPVAARALPNDSMLEEFAPPRSMTNSPAPTPEPKPTAPAIPTPAAPEPVTPPIAPPAPGVESPAPANPAPAPETPATPLPDTPAPEPTPPVDSPKPGYVRAAAPDPIDIPPVPEPPRPAAPATDAPRTDTTTAATLFASIPVTSADRTAQPTPAGDRSRIPVERRTAASRRAEAPELAHVAERPTATPAPAAPKTASDAKHIESATPAFRLTAVRDDDSAPSKPEPTRIDVKPHAATDPASPAPAGEAQAASAAAPATHLHAPVATVAPHSAPPRPAAPETPAPPAPVHAPDVPDTSEARPADPLRDITVRIPTDNDQVVSVRVSQRGESVQVGVRASNPEVANVLRRDLPDLVDGLRREGFRSEVAATASASSRLEPASDPARFDSQQNPNGHPRSRPDTDDWSEQRGRRPKPQYEAEIDD